MIGVGDQRYLIKFGMPLSITIIKFAIDTIFRITFSLMCFFSNCYKGTAEVVFSRRQDAQEAVKRYNNVQLDGKPMKIEVVGTNIGAPAMPPFANASFRNSNGVPRR